MHKTVRLVLRFVVAGLVGEVTRALVTRARQRSAARRLTQDSL